MGALTDLACSASVAGVLLDPRVHHSCDLKVILLQEEKVTVAADADARELDPVGLDAALL